MAAGFVSVLRSISYLLVSHFKEFEGRLLQGVGRLLDVLSRFRVLVGQNFTDLCDLLLQLGALREDRAKRNWLDWLSHSSVFEFSVRWLILYLISWQLVFELLHLGLGVVHDALSRVHSLHTVLQQATSA